MAERLASDPTIMEAREEGCYKGDGCECCRIQHMQRYSVVIGIVSPQWMRAIISMMAF